MKTLNTKLQAQFDNMSKTGKLFRSAMTGQQVWDLYLASFEADPKFRDPDSSEHNCNLCNNFLRRYGNIVSMTEDFKLATIFDIEITDEFKPVMEALSKALKAAPISEVFFETFQELNSLPYESCTKSADRFQLGMAKNVKRYTKEEAEKFGVVKPNEIRTFEHMHLFVNKMFVDNTGVSVESIMGTYRDAKNVFQRAMESISLDTLMLVKDLINQGSLLDGTTHLFKIDQIIPMKKEYDSLAADQRDNWCWMASYKLPYAKFRNELIGVLCSELSEGKEINEACKAWNIRVDPANYMKAVAPITKKQIEEARKFVEQNGYEESFDRRPATIEDIKASEILHLNAGKGGIKNASVFDGVKSAPTRHKRNEFDGVEEVPIEKFMKDILPGCTSIEVLLKNTHEGNMVTLTTANNPESKKMFKWDNNYSWTFNGNLAGKSQIKQAVKSRGGSVEGVMRVSLSFPDTTDDYDLYMKEPSGNMITYSNLRVMQSSSGMLDLDAQGRDGHQQPEKRVENIIYTDKSRIPKGYYEIMVDNYSKKGLHTPFNIEIEIEGEATLLRFKGSRTGNRASVARIAFDGNEFKVQTSDAMDIIESNSISKEIYGLETNQFQKVNLLCLSPNHWDGNNVGNKHYMFMLEGAKASSDIRSFHNENLKPELAEHRKVMEVLGTTNMIRPADKQLSGLGFNATVRDEVIVRLSGTHKRTVKLKF